MKFNLLTTLLFLYSLKSLAQGNTDTKATVTIATMYSSNVSYYGQSTTEKLPYVLLNATWRAPSGIHFSAGSYKLVNYGAGVSEADLGAGFDFNFNEDFSMGVAYSRSFFPSDSPLLQASNENNVNLSANYSFPIWKSDFSADYAFGRQSDLFLSLNNSREIDLGSFLSSKNAFYIEPAIELVAGTRRFYHAYTIAKEKRNKGKGKGAASQGNSGNASGTTSVESNSFNLLSSNFRLPLTLSRANYLIEVSYQFSILVSKAETELKQQQSLFGISFYYQF